MIPNEVFQGSFLERLAKRAHETRLKQLDALSVPWTPTIKWQPELYIKGATFQPHLFFPDLAPSDGPGPPTEEGQGVASADDMWHYANKRLPRGKGLATYAGRRLGQVFFDTDVVVPALYYRKYSPQSPWEFHPFMSLTPMEIMTLRPGTRLAKGHTVIAGLGLGHQLLEVCKRPQVAKVTIIEKSQGLVDFLWPLISEEIARTWDKDCVPTKLRPSIELIIDDAHKVLKKISADVALVDIFPKYGGNTLHYETPKIGKVWCWGGCQ